MMLITTCILVIVLPEILTLYREPSDVVELTEESFDKLVLHGDSMWLVEFYIPTCGYCRRFVPEFTKAAFSLKGFVNVGAVNADKYRKIRGRYKVRSFPTVKFFGAGQPEPDNYKGNRTAEGLVDAVLSYLRARTSKRLSQKSNDKFANNSSENVFELTDDNFESQVLNSEDMWLVNFYVPWCEYCKVLEPHWAQAAKELKGKVKLGSADATIHQNLSDEFNISGYPTILMFPAGNKSFHIGMEYFGRRSTDDIVEWALNELYESMPAPAVVQVTGQESLIEACEKHLLCVIAILPHILDCQADCRNEYLNTISSLAVTFKRHMWGWIWFEAGAQKELEMTLDIGGSGYPTITALNTKKMMYSPFRGSFTFSRISEFLVDILVGRGASFVIKGATLPDVTSTDPWDGKDGQIQQEVDINGTEYIKCEL